MTPAFRRLAFAAALLSQSCISSCLFTNTKPPACGSTGIAFPSTVKPEEIHGAGQDVNVQLVYELSTNCIDQAGPKVTGITLEVSDPDGSPVSAESSPPSHGSGQYGNEAWSTDVRFTPNKPGAYHVLATFEPGVGLVQRDVWVAVDRRADAPTSVVLPSSNCEHFERTSRGAVVCNENPAGARMFRNGTEVAAWSYGTARVTGDVIWVAGDVSGLTRNLDTGTGPPQLSASTASSVGVRVFAVTQDEAMLWSNDSFKLFHFIAGSFSTDSVVQLSSVSVEPKAVAFSSSAHSLLVSDWNRWTRVPIASGFSAPDANWTEKEDVVFQAPDGLWLEIDSSTYKFVPTDPARPTVTLVAPVGWQTSIDGLTSLQSGERPLLFKLITNDYTTNPNGDLPYQSLDRSEVLVPSVQGSAIQLTAFAAPPDAGFFEVTQDSLRAMLGAEQLLWPLDETPAP